MTRVLFVRHGSHDRLDHILCGRMSGVRLSERGREEVLRLADRLAREPLTRIATSPLERTRETAALIAERLKLPVDVEAALEEIDVGAWTGRPFAELREDADWRAWNARRSQARAPRGESMLEVQVRVARWLERLRRTSFGDLLAVTHADVVKAAVASALGLSLDHLDRFEIAPASVTILLAEPWGLMLKTLNEAPL